MSEEAYDSGMTVANDLLGQRAVFLTGSPQPGVNVDKLDIEAGMKFAVGRLGFTTERSQMFIHYALQRWARGEEEQADKMVTKGIEGIRLEMTTWRMILAAAKAAAE